MTNELKKRIFSSIILTPILFFFIIKGSYYFSFLVILSFFIAIYEWHFLAKKKPFYLLGLIFLIFSFYSIYQIRFINENSYKYFLIILIICIFTDIGGYVFGKTFKGPKLTSYSPNKTISGLIGSYICYVLNSFLIYFEQFETNYIFKIIILFFYIYDKSTRRYIYLIF